MIQEGHVRRIEGQKVWVEVNQLDRGDGKSMMACCNDTGTLMEGLNKYQLALEPGDWVRLNIPPKMILVPVAAGILFPLACFFLAYIAAGPLFGIVAEMGKVGIGIAGLIPGIGVSFLYFRIFGPGPELPWISKPESRAEKDHEDFMDPF